jgi:hypothetical protein
VNSSRVTHILDRPDPISSFCGIVLENGKDCPGYVRPESPVNLCDRHFEVAYEWHLRQGGDDPEVMPDACRCGSWVGRKYPGDKWVCNRCGFVVNGPAEPSGYDFTRTSVVYYIRFADRIKIGTSTNPRPRLRSLPHDEVLAFELGDHALEKKRHTQFAATRIPGGEWFVPSDELSAHIRKLRAGVDDPWVQYEFWDKRDRKLRADLRAARERVVKSLS